MNDEREAEVMTIETPADLLRAGAAAMRERGLARGYLLCPEGRVCAQGAMGAALGATTLTECIDRLSGNYLFYRATWAIDRTVGMNLVTWNNDHAIDAEDVASHMEKAAALWEETDGLVDG